MIDRALIPHEHDVDRTIRIAQDNLANHRHWSRWRRAGHLDNPMAGDLAHHEEAIEEYELILTVLRAAQLTWESMR